MRLLKIESLNAFLARFSKREKLILYYTIFFVSLMLLDRMIVFPIYSRIQELNKKIREEEEGIKRSLRIAAQKDRISLESARFGSFLSEAKSEEEEMTVLLREAENLAGRTSVYIVDMKPAGVKEIGAFKKYFVNLNCEAQMEQIVNFMYSIENSNKLLTVEKYQMAPKSKESTVVVCSISISKISMP